MKSASLIFMAICLSWSGCSNDGDAGADTETLSDFESSGSDGDSDTDSDADADVEEDTDTDVETGSDADSETDGDTDSETDGDTDSASGGDTDSGDADSETGSDTNAGPAIDTDSSSDTNTRIDSGVDGDTDSETNSDGEADAGADGDASVDTADEDCPTELHVVYHDFEPDHPDFGCSMSGSSITPGLVLDTLDADRKPQYNPDPPPSPDGNSDPMITSAETFYEWFHDVPGINVISEGVLDLYEDPPGSGIFHYESEDHVIVPGTGDFTTEIHSEFVYEEGQVFTFSGDDDVWVFIDNQLVVDVGGLHQEETGSVNLDELGLTPGETYAIDMFHAERCYPVSIFKLETSIDCFTPIIII